MPGNGNRGARGINYVYSPRKGRSQEESLEHMERWEPAQTDINCRTCGLTCNEKLNEFNLLTTYRCPQGHKNFRI